MRFRLSTLHGILLDTAQLHTVLIGPSGASGVWRLTIGESTVEVAEEERDRFIRAWVHATLALAAAVAATIPDVDVEPDATEWITSGVLLPEDDQ